MLRSRWVVLMFAVAAMFILVAVDPSHAAPAHVVAQADSEAEEDDPEQSQTEGETGGEGQSDPEAETGAGAEGSEAAEPETGPPWTFQMARIGLVLLAFLALSIGMAYYRFVASRRRGAA